jgi:hypothetical protein
MTRVPLSRDEFRTDRGRNAEVAEVTRRTQREEV